MAETWKIVVWVIFVIVLLLVIGGIVASVYICLRRRKKKARRKRVRWNSGDQTDSSSKRVRYNVRREGDIEISEETDAGGKTTTQEKASESKTKNDEGPPSDKDEKKRRPEDDDVKQNIAIMEESVNKPVTIETTPQNATQSGGGSAGTRERLQPVKLVPLELTSQTRSQEEVPISSLHNHTNLGYCDQHNQHSSYQASTVRFQQPAAVVRTFVHPGGNGTFAR